VEVKRRDVSELADNLGGINATSVYMCVRERVPLCSVVVPVWND
jgi:hypothetical protein